MLHMRCCAHILNLVVSEGLKDLHTSISAIRNAVRYVRSSPSRLGKFKQAIQEEHITHKSLVCLDVPTRWNSTFKMLEAAEKYQKAFERLEEDDMDYSIYFMEDSKRVGPPTTADWNNGRAFVNFLKIFYDVTLSLSGSLYVTSNSAYTHLSLVQSEIKKWTESDMHDSLLHVMALDMKAKYEKYWGRVENINPLLFIANVLDPRYKLAYVKWSFEEIYGENVAQVMGKKVKDDLVRMYEWYSIKYGHPSSSSTSRADLEHSHPTPTTIESHAHKARCAAFRSHLKKKDTIEAKNEVERFLNEACVDEDESFDILAWWKVNASRFNILSKIARDVLAVPVSTVASESAFSTGGRVLDQFRSSLAPKMTEALICTQNWLRPSTFDFHDIDYDDDELQKCEEIELGNNLYKTYIILVFSYLFISFHASSILS